MKKFGLFLDYTAWYRKEESMVASVTQLWLNGQNIVMLTYVKRTYVLIYKHLTSYFF